MPDKVLVFSRFPKAMLVRFGERFELLDAGGKPPADVFTPEQLSAIRAMDEVDVSASEPMTTFRPVP